VTCNDISDQANLGVYSAKSRKGPVALLQSAVLVHLVQ
jgi:hypothetical protein